MKTIIIIIFFSFCVFDFFAQKPVLTVSAGHSGYVSSVCFSPDGKYALSGCSDNTIKLWDISTGNEIRTFSGHSANVSSVCFSPDGTYALSASEDKTIVLWEILSGKKIKTFAGHSGIITSVCFSHDGKYALSGSFDNTLKLWDISTGKEVKTFSGHSNYVSSVCFSPDGKYALSGSWDNTLKLWDISTGKEVKTFSGHNQAVYSVSFSLDGKYALSGSNDKTLKLWEINTGKEIKTFSGHTDRVCSVSFSSDGKYALSGSFDKTLKLWDISTGKELKTFLGKEFVISVCFSPDVQYALSSSVSGDITFWDISTGKEIRIYYGHPSNFVTVSLSPDGKYLLSGIKDVVLKLWEISKGKEVRTFPRHSDWISCISFSPDSKYAISGMYNNDTLTLWEISTGKKVRTFSVFVGHMLSVCFSPDNKYALSGGTDSTLKLLEISSGKVVRPFSGHSGSVTSVCFSIDGKYALSGSEDKTLKLWEISTGKEIRTFSGHSGIITSVCFSPDGKYALSESDDKTFKLWEISSGKEIRTLEGHSTSHFWHSINFSPDSKYALSGSEDNSIKLWEISTGKEVRSFTGHSNRVNSVSFSLDGKKAISSAEDKTIKFWDVANGKELCTIYYIDKEDWIVLTQDGRFDGTEVGMKKLYYVKGMEIIPLESLFEQYYTPNLFARVMSGEQFAPLQNVSDLKPKPLVKIISPDNNSKVSSEQLTVTVDVTDQGGGIDEILLYHNGKLIQTTNRGFKLVAQIGSKQTKTFSISLSNGENKIKATAFNTQRTEAIPVEITVNYIGTQVTKPNLYLFIIGINEYKNSKYNLNYAVADAQGFKQEIEQGSSIIFNSIKTVFISNADATKPRILQEISNIKSQTKQEDVFIFYYAGHGVMSEEQIPQFYIIPHNVTQLYGNNQALQTNGISAIELKQFSTEIKAQKQMYILDACQSGGMVGMLASRGAAEEKAVNQLARSTGTYWLAASGSEQFAGEFAQLGHGIFTYCILQGLSGKADAQNDKKVTVQELSSYLNDQVPIISKQYKGSEQYPNTYGYGHDFPIVIVK